MQQTEAILIPSGLLDAVREFPSRREVEHCGTRFTVSSLDIYGTCPNCGTAIKLRSVSAEDEIEDLFDALTEWMMKPGARETLERRLAEVRDDSDE